MVISEEVRFKFLSHNHQTEMPTMFGSLFEEVQWTLYVGWWMTAVPALALLNLITPNSTLSTSPPNQNESC